MIEIHKTLEFSQWLDQLKDRRAAVRVLVRIDRIQQGNLGDHKSVGEGVSELRITYGSGYRVYYSQPGEKIIILLVGSDKSSQTKDIEKAKKILKSIQEAKNDPNHTL